MTFRPAPIAIVGGGPCGLTFARLLECAGIDYIVFERDSSPEPTPHYQGGTLDLHAGTAQAALRRAGLTDEFEKLARRDATTMAVQDSRGSNRTSFGEDRDAPEIDRLQLRQMLVDSLPAHRVRWGKALEVVERDGNEKHSGAAGWKLCFADGSAESGFRLVVGADGSRSKLRQLITSAEPQYSGKMFIEGRLSHHNPQYNAALEMVGAGNSLTMGKGAILCVQQMSDRTYRVYMGLQAPESLTRPGGDADLTNTDKARAAMLNSGRFYANWAPHLKAFIADAEGPWRAWPWCRIDCDVFKPTPQDNKGQSKWTRNPGIVLLGDAAHAGTPNGEGANQAMYDALVLFERINAELGACDDSSLGEYNKQSDSEMLERAVIAYEAEMRPRAYGYLQRCIESEGALFADDAAQRLLDMVKAKKS